MDKELKQRWIDALKGEYANRKGFGQLCDAEGNMCCLGVIADMHGDLIELPNNVYDFNDDSFPFKRSTIPNMKYGISEEHIERLMRINDNNDSFLPVIKYIEKNM